MASILRISRWTAVLLAGALVGFSDAHAQDTDTDDPSTSGELERPIGEPRSLLEQPQSQKRVRATPDGVAQGQSLFYSLPHEDSSGDSGTPSLSQAFMGLVGGMFSSMSSPTYSIPFDDFLPANIQNLDHHEKVSPFNVDHRLYLERSEYVEIPDGTVVSYTVWNRVGASDPDFWYFFRFLGQEVVARTEGDDIQMYHRDVVTTGGFLLHTVVGGLSGITPTTDDDAGDSDADPAYTPIDPDQIIPGNPTGFETCINHPDATYDQLAGYRRADVLGVYTQSYEDAMPAAGLATPAIALASFLVDVELSNEVYWYSMVLARVDPVKIIKISYTDQGILNGVPSSVQPLDPRDGPVDENILEAIWMDFDDPTWGFFTNGPTVRDSYYADIVLFGVGNTAPTKWAGRRVGSYASFKQEDGSVGRLSNAHEISHIFGCKHQPQVFDTDNPETNPYIAHRYAHNDWPDCTPSLDSVTTSQAGGKECGTKVERVSNPNIFIDGEAFGSTIPDDLGRYSDCARRTDEVAPYVAASWEKPPNDPEPDLPSTCPELTSHEGWTSVSSGPNTFQWSVSPVGTAVELVLGNRVGDEDVVRSTTSASVTVNDGALLPGETFSFNDFVWTRLSTPDCVVEYRFNASNRWIGCDVESPSQLPFGAHALRDFDCNAGGVVCTGDASTGKLHCTVDRGSNGVETCAAGAMTDGPGDYNYVVGGMASNDQNFCCLYRDDYQCVTDVEFYGSTLPDYMGFTDQVSAGLTGRYTTRRIRAYMRGRKEDDVLYGSHAYMGYEETLRGDNGDDVHYGNAGDDTIIPSNQTDVVYAGEGDDVIVSRGSKNTLDILWGGPGDDLICTDDGTDRMYGAGSSNTWDYTEMYISSTWGGSIDPFSSANGAYSNCGDVSHGTGWGNCDAYILVGAPQECADWGLPD